MENLLLIGTGPMAIEYMNVLAAMSIKPIVIGRGEKSANVFKEITGVKPHIGGIDGYLSNTKIEAKTTAIIATGTETLMVIMLQLLNAGVKKILIEKPAAISIDELLENEKMLKQYEDSIFIAYNRRFYASVIEAERLITEDGGLQSMHFEFTEWAHKIEPLKMVNEVKENWFFANSTHVVDLAFYFSGKPTNWNAFSKPGELTWHSKTNFVGAGETEKGILFSYISNWESAGRWALELLTEKRRIYLKPMESVSLQDKGTVLVKEHQFDDILDIDFKPGLYRQIESFLNNNFEKFVNIKSHIENSRNIYSKMLS
jgi:predicted dehydrogenase